MANRNGRNDERENSGVVILTERDEVRRWADENDIVPVADAEARGETPSELVRRDEMRDTHEEREWDVFFDEFDARERALVYGGRGGDVGEHRLVDRADVDEATGRHLGTDETQTSTGSSDQTDVMDDSTDRTNAEDEEGRVHERRDDGSPETNVDTDETDTATGAEATEAEGGEEHPGGQRDVGAHESMEISERLMGRSVELGDGEEVGIVSDVDEDEKVIYVDANPGLVDELKAHLHWSDEEDATTLTEDQIRAITYDAVVVRDRDIPD